MVASSTEVSPYTTPYGSATSSPANSRTPSPNKMTVNEHCDKSKSLPVGKSLKLSPFPSPLQLLHRANSYRKGQKTQNSTPSGKDTLTRSRLRSKSTPSIVYSISRQSITSASKDESANEDLSVDDSYLTKRKTSCPEQQQEMKTIPAIPRKKSLSSLFELKKNKTQIAKMKKSVSQPQKLHKEVARRKSKEKEERDKDPALLFQATTMFIPGYDFKTKQTTALVNEHRRQSTPLFSRRSSKEKIYDVSPPIHKDRQKEKQKSSPNLTKTQKNERMEIRRDFQRSDSLPVQIMSSGDECSVCGEEIGELVYDDFDMLTLSERKAVIINRQKEFAEYQKAKSRLEVPNDAHSKVKKLSSGFEHGKPFWKRYKQKKKTLENIRWHRSCEIEHDSIYRQRARSYETGQAFRKPDSFSDTYSQSSESGYASPTDNNNIEICISDSESQTKHYDILQDQSRDLYKDHSNDDVIHHRKPNIVLSAYDESLSSSWSHGEWRRNNSKSKSMISPDLKRVIATDFCVTEL